MRPEHLIIIVSVIGGIIGGMGMGGGTLLIPLLTLFAGLEQHLAQAINLMAFVPMSVIALCIHKKNGYVCPKKALPVAAIALIGAVIGSLGANYAKGTVLKICFGAFLIVLGIYQTYKAVRQIVEKARAKKQDQAIAAQKNRT